MKISCRACNIKNDVIEFQELKDIEKFKDRFLIVGVCKRCNKTIATLVETRKSDNKTFIDKFHDTKAKEVIKREKKRVKYKIVEADYKFFKWTYGKNVEIKRNGKTVQVRQYACDYQTDKKKLLKTTNK